MEVYLDNSATTMCYPEVGELVYKVMCRDYGNPSSLYRKGVEAERYIRDAKETVAKLLKVNNKEIFFTSGGTESDNLALIGCARANRRRGNHLITSSIEHPAILNTMRYLEEEEGFRVTYLPVDEAGRIQLDALREALCPETILVSVMYVNNEVGTVQPIHEAVQITKRYNSSILLHTDAVQGIRQVSDLSQAAGYRSSLGERAQDPWTERGGVPLHRQQGEDTSHYVRRGQQRDIRSGTENVPGIAGIGLASSLIYRDLEMKTALMRELKAYFIERILQMEDTVVHGVTDEESAPHIISVGVGGVRSEVLLHTLEDKGICVSSGSACSSNHPAVSGVLKAIGAPREYLDATVRFSMSEFTTKEEIDYTLETLYNCIPMLRKFTRR